MIKENLLKLKNNLPDDVELIAVSKTKPSSMIKEAYNTGHLDFGENKVQELITKHPELPSDIRWHMIGHLQSNKVKYIAPFIHMIHGVDSLKLLKEINKQAKKHNKIINCLLQFHIAEESSKYGLSYESAKEIIDSKEFNEFNNVCICGVMGMATYTNDSQQVSSEFSTLYEIFTNLAKHLSLSNSFKIVSMGMSNDYELAIIKGSNMIRVGSRIFGNRLK